MRILILGGDGYLGWPTSMYLSKRGHEVCVVDNFAKRQWEAECGVSPLWPVAPLHERVKLWNQITNGNMKRWTCDIAENRGRLYTVLEEFKPDTIVHYAEQPSAPYSMMDAERCVRTQRNNVLGTLNVLMGVLHYDRKIHLIKLGTMGEYGTPNIQIEEGWLDITHKDRTDRVLYPKKPGSWYHLSKVHDSHNLEFACRVWGIRVTDLNQGVVYGTDTDETWLDKGLQTSFHYDAIFGTVINRFITQAAAKEPLTVYGNGSQTRGYLDIRDTIRCVEIACENPAEAGEFRVMNQFTEQFTVNELADMVKATTVCEISHIPNPRVEQEDHFYEATHTKLTDLGLKPHLLIPETLISMLGQVLRYKKQINKDLFKPTIKWRN